MLSGQPSVTLLRMPLPVRVRALLSAAAAASTLVLVALAVPPGAPRAERVLLGEGTVQPSTDSNPNGMAEAFSTQAGATGRLDELRVYVDGCSRASTLTAGLYTDADGHPGRSPDRGVDRLAAAGDWNAVRVPAADVTAGRDVLDRHPRHRRRPAVLQRPGRRRRPAETSAELTLTSLPQRWRTGTKYPDGPLAATGVATAAVPQPAAARRDARRRDLRRVGAAGRRRLHAGRQDAASANAGDGALSFTASEDAGWLTVSPAAGDAPGDLTVAVDATGLREGRYERQPDGHRRRRGRLAARRPDHARRQPRAAAAALDPKPGLVGAWGFEEGAGEATDLSGWGNDGTIRGAQRVAGRFGDGLELLRGRRLGRGARLPPAGLHDPLTLEAWVQPGLGRPRAGARCSSRSSPRASPTRCTRARTPGCPAAICSPAARSGSTVPSRFPPAAWSHVATTYDGATVRLYVGGTEVASRPQTGAVTTSDGALHIGGNAVWGEWFEGRIDEVRAYRRALTASEIASDATPPVVGR